MKKLIFIAFLLISTLFYGQMEPEDPSAFNEGIKLPNIEKATKVDSVLVVDGEGVAKYVLKEDLAPKLNLGYGLSMVNDTLISGVVYNYQDVIDIHFYPDTLDTPGFLSYLIGGSNVFEICTDKTQVMENDGYYSKITLMDNTIDASITFTDLGYDNNSTLSFGNQGEFFLKMDRDVLISSGSKTRIEKSGRDNYLELTDESTELRGNPLIMRTSNTGLSPITLSRLSLYNGIRAGGETGISYSIFETDSLMIKGGSSFITGMSSINTYKYSIDDINNTGDGALTTKEYVDHAVAAQSVNGLTGTVSLEPIFSNGVLSITGSGGVTLDTRYYTKGEVDATYLKVSGTPEDGDIIKASLGVAKWANPYYKSIVTITDDYTVLPTDHTLIYEGIDDTDIITLPTASQGRMLIVVLKARANFNVPVQTITGSIQNAIPTGAYQMQFDGTDWQLIIDEF